MQEPSLKNLKFNRAALAAEAFKEQKITGSVTAGLYRAGAEPIFLQFIFWPVWSVYFDWLIFGLFQKS